MNHPGDQEVERAREWAQNVCTKRQWATVQQDEASIAELLAAYSSSRDAEKESGVAVHIKNAASDGCMCEPCIAARESQKSLVAELVGALTESARVVHIARHPNWVEFKDCTATYCAVVHKLLARAKETM